MNDKLGMRRHSPGTPPAGLSGDAATLRDRLGLSGKTLVAGLGISGFSCARFLHRLGLEVAVTDSRTAPPMLEHARRELPDMALYLGELSYQALENCDQLIASPGLSLRHPFMERARGRGITIAGDIELFARAAQAPVIAVTGSNGKSTVTALVGEMARSAGRRVRVGGNIGVPALELLYDAPAEDSALPPPRTPSSPEDLYVLELSSFQLETTWSLRPQAAVVLNMTPDHMDRYGDLEEYLAAKLRVYRGAEVAVINRDDPLLRSHRPDAKWVLSFSAGAPLDEQAFGLVRAGGRQWLARGDERLLPVDELGIRGGHNALNALAALALGTAAGLSTQGMLVGLRAFPGLPHRMQRVGERGGVTWYNDSKGTNVGATLAAVQGLEGSFVLIAGGLGKDQDFSPLRAALTGRARAVVLIGRDAPLIEQTLRDAVPTEHASDLGAAVRRAAEIASPGDSVVLSPACASFDMFSGYEERGERFVEAVKGLGA